MEDANFLPSIYTQESQGLAGWHPPFAVGDAGAALSVSVCVPIIIYTMSLPAQQQHCTYTVNKNIKK